MDNINVLIVDDLYLMRRVIKQSLQSIGIKNTNEAKDGIDALKILKQEKCDLILLDWLMPNLNGMQLVDILKKEPNFKEIPIIMITTVDDKNHILEALQQGVTEYIAKPFTPDCLREKVLNVVKTYKLISEEERNKHIN